MCIALSLDLGLVLDFTDVVISPLKKKHNASGIGLRNVKIQYLDKDVKKKAPICGYRKNQNVMDNSKNFQSLRSFPMIIEVGKRSKTI